MPCIFVPIHRAFPGSCRSAPGLARPGGWGHRVGFKLPEAHGESHVVLARELVQVLVAQEQHLVLQQGGVDFVEQAVIAHRVAKIHVEQFRADGTGQLFDCIPFPLSDFYNYPGEIRALI